MRDEARIKRIVNILYRVWELYPDLRIGQLLSIAATYGDKKFSKDVFPIEDDIMESGLKMMLKKYYENKTSA
jgi:uncharacterized protein YihD (DUF1040 family)